MYVNTVIIPHPKVTIAVHWLSCEPRGKFRKPTLVHEEDAENAEKGGVSGGCEGHFCTASSLALTQSLDEPDPSMTKSIAVDTILHSKTA